MFATTETTASDWAEHVRKTSGRDCLVVVSDDGRTVRASDHDGPRMWAMMYCAIIGAPVGWEVEEDASGSALMFRKL